MDIVLAKIMHIYSGICNKVILQMLRPMHPLKEFTSISSGNIIVLYHPGGKKQSKYQYDHLQ